jgi:EpsI family protein
VNLRASLWLTGALLLAGAAAMGLTPKVQTEAVGRPLAQSIPTAFGDWKEVKKSYVQVDPTITRSGETSLNQPYDDILARAYQNSKGEVVMLSLAYGHQQRQEVKIHRPDLCYTAQGFTVISLQNKNIALAGVQAASVSGKRMKAMRDARIDGYTELVSYWMRIGSVYSESAWDTRLHILTEGIAGRVPDGVLVRASRVAVVGQDEAAAHAALEAFLVELVSAAPLDARRMLVH